MEAQNPSDTGIEPIADRPRMFGGRPKPVPLQWKWAVERLLAAENC
jgi:hypothetical protein